MVDWNTLDAFNRHDNISKKLPNESNNGIFTFDDEGKEVKADVLGSAMKSKGIKGMKAKDSIVFIVENDKTKYELWLSATNFSALRELKAVRDANNNSLRGAKVRITRASKGDVMQSAYTFSKA